MAYIPSSDLATVLDKAKVGVWFDAIHDGRTVLVCKMPETVIKALHRGAGASLLTSVVQAEGFSIMCVGFRVQDEPDNPFTATIASISLRDLAFDKGILSSQFTTLHCLNEFNHPVLSADCLLEPGQAWSTLEGLDLANPYLPDPSTDSVTKPSEFLRIVDLALDRFQQEIYRPTTTPAREYIEATGRIPLTLSLWKAIEVFEVSPTLSAGPFRIDDTDEGKKQERAVHLLLDSMYPGSTYRSPRVQEGSSVRELIDALSIGSESICLLESKGMAVLTGAIGRSSQRRAATVTKHVTKGLKQLQGALTSVRSGSQIYDAEGQPIVLPGRENLPAHAVVLLSEMYPFLDWQRFASEVIASSENERYRALFHIMDVSELSYLIKVSEDAAAFNLYLMQRWLGVKLKGTAYLRVKIPTRS